MRPMANAGHVDIVRDRIDLWNEWRRKNTKVVPDFSGADLSELNLVGANLAKADLSGVWKVSPLYYGSTHKCFACSPAAC